MRAEEDRGRRPAREEAVTAGVGAAKANGRRRAGMGRGAQRRTAAGAGWHGVVEDTAAACLVRVASRPTRIDAPKKFWTRVSR